MSSHWDDRPTTKSEIEFLDKLGTYSVMAQKDGGVRRQRLLMIYIEVADSRVWPKGVDKRACVAHACKLAGVEK